MQLILEIIIYLLVVLGLITVCYTFFNKSSLIDSVILNRSEVATEEVETYTYVREKKEGEKLVVNVRYKNISVEELDKIKETIQNGAYNNIMDIADEVNYIEAIQKKPKPKKK